MNNNIQAVNQKGETLLELTMAAGLAVLVISALTITTIIGLRNTQLSQNQTQATKLAQEGLEHVRSIRSRNQTVCLLSGPITWDNLLSSAVQLNKTEFKQDVSTCDATAANLAITNSGNPDLSPTPQLPFTRRIYLQKTDANQITVTAQVSWTDYSGSHHSELITILSNQ